MIPTSHACLPNLLHLIALVLSEADMKQLMSLLNAPDTLKNSWNLFYNGEIVEQKA